MCVPFLIVAILVGSNFGLDKFFLATLIESLLVLAWLGLLSGMGFSLFGTTWFTIGFNLHVERTPPLIALATMFLSLIAFILVISSQRPNHPDRNTSHIPVPIFRQSGDAV